MILDEITLTNFGLYGGSQSVELTPPSPDKPVILFGGLNGGGKTTVLDALQLGLFGQHARTSNRGTGPYRDYLENCIHRHAKSPEAGISIRFRHRLSGTDVRYCLYRSWRRENGTCKESFQVMRDDRHEPTLAENWPSIMEDLFPASIAHLFLFDGEQIESYASEEKSSALIYRGIQSLLGLDLVDQLEKDIQVYERRKRTEAKNDTAQAEIAAEERYLSDLRGRGDELRQERAALLTHQIDRKRKELDAVEQVYRRLGGELYEQRKEIESRLVTAESEVNEGADEMREQAGGALPFLLVRGLLESAANRDQLEEDSRRSREVSGILEDRDRRVVEHLKSESVHDSVIESLDAYLERDRGQRVVRGQRPSLLGLSPNVRRDLHDLLARDLSEASTAFSNCFSTQRDVEARAAAARTEFENVPSTEAIAESMAQRDAIGGEIESLEVQYAALGNEIERLEREIGRREQSLVRLLRARATDRSNSEDRQRILRHADRVRTTLGTFRSAVVARHVQRIEDLVLESYVQLLHKASLVTRLRIDPERFSLTLFGRDGRVMSPDRLSAGERQLLAVALLWGLAKASGRPLPTAIDTPLGRLDTSHRMHLVERYFPHASHQMLLLSTDEEISGKYLDRLRPWIGRSYRLVFDDDAGRSTIVPGYFDS